MGTMPKPDVMYFDERPVEREADDDLTFFSPVAQAEVLVARLEKALELSSFDYPTRFFLYAKQVRECARRLQALVGERDAKRKRRENHRVRREADGQGIPPMAPPDTVIPSETP